MQTVTIVEFTTEVAIRPSTGNLDARYEGYGYIDDTNRSEHGSHCLIIYEGSPKVDKKVITAFFNDAFSSRESTILCHSSKIKELNTVLRATKYGQLKEHKTEPNIELLLDWQREIINKSRDNINPEVVNVTRVFLVEGVQSVITAKDIMTPKPYTVYPDYNVNEIDALMFKQGIGHCPVVDPDSGELLGIVSDTDVLPYMPPENYPGELKYKKQVLARKTTAHEIMTEINRITTFILEDEEPSTFIPKFFRRNAPAFNLLMVLNSGNEKVLKGVISWINILKNWERFNVEHLNSGITRMKAIDVAVPLTEIPFLDEDNYTAYSGLARSEHTVHRHLRIIKEGELNGLIHFNELLPYQPIGKDIPLTDYFSKLQVTAIKPKYSVENRSISQDLPIWIPDGDCVIRKFLSYVIGDGKKWQDRMAGFLVISEGDNIPTHLLNPYNVIERML